MLQGAFPESYYRTRKSSFCRIPFKAAAAAALFQFIRSFFKLLAKFFCPFMMILLLLLSLDAFGVVGAKNCWSYNSCINYSAYLVHFVYTSRIAFLVLLENLIRKWMHRAKTTFSSQSLFLHNWWNNQRECVSRKPHCYCCKSTLYRGCVSRY